MRIGAIAGCFDGLHPGHMKILKFAKSMCDKLIVFINDDEYILNNKGHMTIYNEYERVEMLHLFGIEDVVIFNDNRQLQNLMSGLGVNVVFVGDDYRNKKVVKPAFCEEVIYYPRDEYYSTTNLIERIKIKGEQ